MDLFQVAAYQDYRVQTVPQERMECPDDQVRLELQDSLEDRQREYNLHHPFFLSNMKFSPRLLANITKAPCFKS